VRLTFIGYIGDMPAKQLNEITLAIDIGGTGIKAMLLDASGKPMSERQRALTPKPGTTAAILTVLDAMKKKL
jgi:polyphosphate glucokinase